MSYVLNTVLWAAMVCAWLVSCAPTGDMNNSALFNKIQTKSCGDPRELHKTPAKSCDTRVKTYADSTKTYGVPAPINEIPTLTYKTKVPINEAPVASYESSVRNHQAKNKVYEASTANYLPVISYEPPPTYRTDEVLPQSYQAPASTDESPVSNYQTSVASYIAPKYSFPTVYYAATYAVPFQPFDTPFITFFPTALKYSILYWILILCVHAIQMESFSTKI